MVSTELLLWAILFGGDLCLHGYEVSHSVLGGDIRITPVLFALHLLHVLVSGSIAYVSECCLEVLDWVLRIPRLLGRNALLNSG